MSLAGIVNTHILVAYMIATYGTEEQRQRFLPVMAAGREAWGICISEANAGSDVQAITMTAVRDGDDYVLNGSKLWVTNGVAWQYFCCPGSHRYSDSSSLSRHERLPCRERHAGFERKPHL